MSERSPGAAAEGHLLPLIWSALERASELASRQDVHRHWTEIRDLAAAAAALADAGVTLRDLT